MKILKNKRGSTLVYILILLFLSLIVLTAILENVISQIKYGQHRAKELEALQVAEAGVNFYKWYLNHKVMENPTETEMRYFWDNDSPYPYGVSSHYVGEHLGKGEYTLVVTPPPVGSTKVIVDSTGSIFSDQDIEQQIIVSMSKPSLIKYALAMDDVNSYTIFNKTTIWGPIHSNSCFSMIDTVVHGVASSSLYSCDYDDGSPNYYFSILTYDGNPSGPDDDDFPDPVSPTQPPDRPDVFQQGRVLEVSMEDFTSLVVDFGELKNNSGCDSALCETTDFIDRRGEGFNGVYFNDAMHGRRIRLDGTQFWYETAETVNWTWGQIAKYRNSGDSSPNWQGPINIPNGGIIFVEEAVWVEGQVNGVEVTIVSAKIHPTPVLKGEIYLGYDHLLYTNYDGTDKIGLISEGGIHIKREHNESNLGITNVSDPVLRIDAAQLGLGGECSSLNYNVVPAKGSLYTYGSLACQEGFLYVGSGANGIQQAYHQFDSHLEFDAPPYFPAHNEYLVDNWEASN